MPLSQLHFMFVGGRMRRWRGSDDVFFDPDASRDHRLDDARPLEIAFDVIEGELERRGVEP